MERVNKKVIQFFSSLSDETRLKILMGLIENKKTVNEIHNYVGKDKVTLSAISHQLRQLNDIGIVLHKRQGREKIFQLSDNFCLCIIRDAFKHFKEKTKCKKCLKIKNKKGVR